MGALGGMSRIDGSPLTNYESACQAVEHVLSSRIASFPLLREYGGGVIELLGRAMTPPLFAAWRQLVATAIDLWEPRFRVRRCSFSGTAAELRLGKAGLVIEADFRPKGHLGDFTVERVVSFTIGFRNGVTIL